MFSYSWAVFWLTYFIGGCLFYNDQSIVQQNYVVTVKQLLNSIGLNALLTFLCIPLANRVPTLIYVPDTLYGYVIRIICAILIGDLCFYWTHRLLHTSYFYFLHKQHHLYIKPHAMAGVYASPFEMLISNHLSMVLALKLVECHSITMLCVETAVVSANILKSHSSNNNFWTGSPHHNLHHEKMNCNYGFSYITDIAFGTYQPS